MSCLGVEPLGGRLASDHRLSLPWIAPTHLKVLHTVSFRWSFEEGPACLGLAALPTI